MSDPLLYAAPLFAVLMILEAAVLRWGPAPYALRPFLSALGCVALDQLVNLSTLSLFALAYDALHRGAAVLDMTGAMGWCVAVVLHDVAYYAFHRSSHRVHILWAAHVVHHQSETYDLTVSLRQGTIATWITFLFYLPMALVVPTHVFVVVHAAYQLYQFCVHTRLVRTLGPLEWLLATPSHHRVHHGRDRAYVDKNYGGFFIVFDRLLGTFTRETHAPTYGVPGGYDVVSPLFANVYVFGRLIRATREVDGVRAALKLWFGPPHASAYLMSSAGHAPSASRAPARVGRALAPFAIGCGGALLLTFGKSSLPIAVALALAVASIVLVEVGSAILDGRA